MVRSPFVTVLGAAAIALAGMAPSLASADPGDGAPVPSYASHEETIHGRIANFDGKYAVKVRDDRGFVDSVRLHDGTIINPRGLELAEGLSVTILGHSSGNVFDANEIDTPYTEDPGYVAYGYDGGYEGYGYGGYGYGCCYGYGYGYGYGAPFALGIAFGFGGYGGYGYGRGYGGYGYGHGGYGYGGYGHGGYGYGGYGHGAGSYPRNGGTTANSSRRYPNSGGGSTGRAFAGGGGGHASAPVRSSGGRI